MLFDRLEETSDIFDHLNMIMSFSKEDYLLPYFCGINIYNLDIDKIKEFIQYEEPRIIIEDIYIKNHNVKIDFIFNNDYLSFSKDII